MPTKPTTNQNITIVGDGRFGTFLAEIIAEKTGGSPKMLGPEDQTPEETKVLILCVPLEHLMHSPAKSTGIRSDLLQHAAHPLQKPEVRCANLLANA